MKSTGITFFTAILVILFFIGCNNHPINNGVGNTNPLFNSDPDLKNITGQINNSPKDAALFFERGQLLHKMRLDSLAIKDYETASALDTMKAEYYSAVGDLLFEHKDIAGSVQWIQKAIAKNPSDRKAHLKIAKLFLYTRDYTKSIKEIDNVLRQDVYNPEAYFLKGMVYKELKDTARAISSFMTSVQVAPDYRESVIQLGLLYSAKKDPVALKYLDNAFAIDSTDVFPLFAKGVYYQQNDNYPMAKEEYRKCIMRNYHYVNAYFNMGFIYMAEDSVAKAYRQFDIVTKIDYLNPTAFYNRGICSERMDSIKNAIEDYRKAIALDTAYKSPREALKRLGIRN